MSGLTRFGVSLESSLLEKFDRLNEEKGYKNRSEAIRDLIREKFVLSSAKDIEIEILPLISNTSPQATQKCFRTL